jgi:hypothetical protein
MRIAVNIADPLLEQARALAKAEGLTMGNLIEEALGLVIAKRASEPQNFKLRDGTFGDPTSKQDLDWPTIRALIYEGRGG